MEEKNIISDEVIKKYSELVFNHIKNVTKQSYDCFYDFINLRFNLNDYQHLLIHVKFSDSMYSNITEIVLYVTYSLEVNFINGEGIEDYFVSGKINKLIEISAKYDFEQDALLEKYRNTVALINIED